MSAPGPHPVEPLLELALALARDRSDLGPLQRELGCVRDEIGRVLETGAAATSAEATATLSMALRDCGLAILADRATEPRQLRSDLERLLALLATIGATRAARL